MMGCTSTPQQNQQPTNAEPTKQVARCEKISNIPDDYPWSIPGYHSTVSNQARQISITQTRGEPNQFKFCDDCPCPTSKSNIKASASIDQKKATRNLRKIVIQFDNASAQIDIKQQATLKRLFQSLPDSYQLTITGYTDDTAPGGTVENEVLAQQRAQAVFMHLVELGLDENKATTEASPLCCYIAPNNTDAGRALNRRTEILISYSLSTQR